MKRLERVYCRAFQGVFRAALPFMPYREPKILHSIVQIPDVLQERNISKVLLVTDESIRGLGLTKHLEEELRRRSIFCAGSGITAPGRSRREVRSYSSRTTAARVPDSCPLSRTTRRHRQGYTESGNITWPGEALKQASAWICRKPVPVVMTGQEVSMEEQESLTTCPTAWEDTINFPDAGGSPPTSVWLGVPLTCMNCTATGTSSGLGCLSGETLRCTRKEATNGYLPSVTATGCSASVWTVTCNGWTAISMTGRRKRQSP